MLNNLLENTCEKFQDKTALIFFEKKYSYQKLKEISHILASALIHLNIQPNDKVAFFLTNCPEAIVCFTACFKIGAVAVPINQYFNADQLTYVLNEAKPKILITEKELLPELLKIPSEILTSIDCYLTNDSENSSVKSFQSLLNLAHQLPFFPAVQNNQLATLSYTSGSTGNPKGVIHTQSQLYKFIVAHAQLVQYNEQDHVLICVPMAFAYSFSNQVLPCLYSGVTISLIPAGNYEKVIHAIQNNHVTLLYVGPTTFIQLNNVLNQSPTFPHYLRAIISAGDAMPFALQRRAQEIFNVNIYEGIGMTETWLYALNPLDGKIKMGSSGLVCPDMEIKIVDENRQALLFGQIGQIAVKGNSVMQGYYSGSKEDAALENGWFYTGDFGYLDQDGYIFYCGRKETLMIKNGVFFCPYEIEFALYEHPAIYEAGVVFQEDRIVAFVSFHKFQAFNKSNLFIHLKKHLSVNKIPDEIVILPKLPKGVTGKIDRRLLKQWKEL